MPRIGILVVAYNAESTLRSVLHRIPEPIVDKIDEIFIFDDASPDDTHGVAKACQDELPHAKLSVFKNPVNLMYGGNQSKGYQYAMERGPRHRRAAARRRAVRPGGHAGAADAAGDRRGRHGHGLADDGEGRGAEGQHADVQVRRQQDPHVRREQADRHEASPSSTPATAPTRSTRCGTSRSDG